MIAALAESIPGVYVQRMAPDDDIDVAS